MSEIPQAAIDAARAALADLPVGTSLWGYELTNAARRALEAAAPLIAAAVQAEHGPVAYGLGLADGALAEREHCAQLAADVGATYVHQGEYTMGPHSVRQFASLLREQPPTTEGTPDGPQ